MSSIQPTAATQIETSGEQTPSQPEFKGLLYEVGKNWQRLPKLTL